MTSESFVSKVNSLDGCSIVYENENGFILQGSKGGGSRLYLMRSKDVEESRWEDLESVLGKGRSPRIMEQTTRICGYYANLRNFNRSKLAENNDRHKGNYALPEAH